MAQVQIIQPYQPQSEELEKVAAYCRVSTDSKDQLNSYRTQIGYYTNFITQHPGWELADIYADEGITGTSLEKRDEFKRMLQDCRAGKIQRILVKSVSRFVRNTLELFENIQKLAEQRRVSYQNHVDHLFTHRILCPDCGKHFRHIESNKQGYWVCPNRVNGLSDCSAVRLSEKNIVQAALSMMGKLYSHHDMILSPTLSLLEEIAARQEQGNAKLYELNTALADLNEKAHTLQRLHNKGFIEDADFREQSDALASQRKKLTDQRSQAIHGSKALETLDRLRELQNTLAALPEIPWEFDIGLFDHLVEKIVPFSNTELLFKLKCGLELKEVLSK